MFVVRQLGARVTGEYGRSGCIWESMGLSRQDGWVQLRFFVLVNKFKAGCRDVKILNLAQAFCLWFCD